jgi:predicted nucleotidyltransferase component of viral defense system
VEKELLHHDILREMSMAGLLKNLTFIGGTCLRACYGSSRLSEDLDFTGGMIKRVIRH